MRTSLITAMLLITLPMLAGAQGNSAKRAYSWEFSLSGIFQESKGIGSENSSSLQVDSVTGFGLNMAYNFSNKLALGVDLEYLRPKYEAVLVDENGLDDDFFIKIKPTIVNLLFATVLFIGLALKRPYLKLLMGAVLHLDNEGWHKLGLRWAIFFIVLAVLNEVVWRNFSTEFWAGFKLFGLMPLTMIFAIAQVPLITAHQIEDAPADAG